MKWTLPQSQRQIRREFEGGKDQKKEVENTKKKHERYISVGVSSLAKGQVVSIISFIIWSVFLKLLQQC